MQNMDYTRRFSDKSVLAGPLIGTRRLIERGVYFISTLYGTQKQNYKTNIQYVVCLCSKTNV